MICSTSCRYSYELGLHCKLENGRRCQLDIRKPPDHTEAEYEKQLPGHLLLIRSLLVDWLNLLWYL